MVDGKLFTHQQKMSEVANSSKANTVARPPARIFGRVMGGNEARMRYRVFGTPMRKAGLVGALFGVQIMYALYRDLVVHG